MLVFDVFWVFGTPGLSKLTACACSTTALPVMVGVAKGLDAPMKLVLPKLLAKTSAFGMLGLYRLRIARSFPILIVTGLGDIALPGLRKGKSRNPHSACRYLCGCAPSLRLLPAGPSLLDRLLRCDNRLHAKGAMQFHP